MNIKNDLLDGLHRNSVLADFRITELETEIQKQISERNLIETQLGEASKEPGMRNPVNSF